MDIFALNLMGAPATSPGSRPPGEAPAGFAEALLAAVGPPGPSPAPPPTADGAPQGALPNEPNALGTALDLLATLMEMPKEGATLSLGLGTPSSTSRETGVPTPAGSRPETPAITTQSALAALLGALGVETPNVPVTTNGAVKLAADQIAADSSLPLPVRHLAATVLAQIQRGQPVSAESVRPELEALIGRVVLGPGQPEAPGFQTDLVRQLAPSPTPIASDDVLAALRPDWIGNGKPMPIGPLPPGFTLPPNRGLTGPPVEIAPDRGLTGPPVQITPDRGMTGPPVQLPPFGQPHSGSGAPPSGPDRGFTPNPQPIGPHATPGQPVSGTVLPVAPDTTRLTPKPVPTPVDPNKGSVRGPLPGVPGGPTATPGDPVTGATILDPIAEAVKATPIWEREKAGFEAKADYAGEFLTSGVKSESVAAPAPKVMTVDEFRPVREALLRQIQELADAKRPGSMTMRLNPEELGTITVTVRTLGKSFEADVQASHDVVRQSLHAHRTDLVQAVESRGLSMSSFNVGQDAGSPTFQNPQSSAQGQSQSQSQGQPGQSGVMTASRSINAPAPAAAAPTYGFGAAKSVNVVA